MRLSWNFKTLINLLFVLKNAYSGLAESISRRILGAEELELPFSETEV